MQRIQTDFLLLYPLIPVHICLIRDVFVSGELLLSLMMYPTVELKNATNLHLNHTRKQTP